MVAWSIDDSIAITAISDNSIRLWNSKSGDYLGSLLGHSDEIYVMEPHPLCSNILLSAAHDGCIMMWSLKFQKCLMKYNNVIPSEENAALYDAKWTPDGTSVACTDSLGHLLIFGFGSSEHYSKLPKELFFHTDYRPLLRDSFNNVVDEQTQVPPHLLSSPFLVDSEGFPYQPQIQRFVRGREFLSDGEALIPRGPEPSFNINNSLQVPIPDAVSPEAPNVNGEVNLLEEAQAGARAAIHENNLVTDYELPGNVQENKPFNRYILNKNDTKYKGFIDNSLETIKEYSKLESELFLKDREKYLKDHDYLSPACINSKKTNHGLTRKTKTSSQARSRGASVEKLEEDSDEENDEVNDQTSDCSLDESDFSSIEETTYDEASSCNDHSDWGSDNDNTTNIAQSSSTDKKRSPKKNGGRNAAQKCREQIFLSTPRGELAEEYIPSQWLSESIPRKTPYFPQIGDVLMYFKRGHEKYLDLVRDRKTYIINMKEQTWIKKKLCESVMTKVIGIKFEIKPPRLAVLKFQILNLNSGNPTGETFTLKYHDMNDVVDFLVLYQTYSASTNEWKCSDRIRCQIDDCWWKGTVKSIGPETSTSITSSCDECKFLSILCHWDNAEKEFLSPWDLEKLTEDTQDIPDGTLVTPEQLKSCLYKPTVEEWNDIGRDIETKRISAALETIMGLSIAEPFNYPVDQSIYPEYFYSVEYPMDLNLIKARVDNNFYRRIASIEYDLKYIFENAEAFNVPKSDIVKNAKILVRLAGEIINDPGKNKDNVSEIYHNLVQNFLWSSSDEDAVEENPRVKKLLTKNSSESLNPKKWKQDCDDLLTKTLDQPFSGPFRGPVSEIEFPDYHRFIVTPMDLSSVRESLMIGNFNSPVDFQKDIHLMISNSRVFNTNPKSKILIMTNQLEKWIEPKIADLISNWKKTNRRLTLARRKHKIKKEGLRGQSEQQSSSHDQTPSPRGKGKGVGKGKSNNLLKKNNIKPNYEVNDESFSSSSNDDESFSPKKSSSFRRKHTLKKSEDEDYAPLSTWQLRKKRLNTTVESCESDSSSTGSVVGKESKPKPQRTAKPITKLPSSSSSSENDNIPKPSTSSSSSIKTSAGSSSSSALLGEPSKIEDESKSSIVTQVSRSGRLVRKYAWKDYTYSDNDDDDDEEQVESDDDDDAPLVRSKRVKVNNSSSPEKKPRNNPNNSSSSNLSSKTRPLRKVTKVPNVHSDEAAEDGDENFVPVSQCKKTPNAVRSFAASSVKRKKQSEESESEFSESEEDEEESDNNQQTNFVESNSEDYLSDENINQHAPPLSRQHQRDLERKKNKPKSQYQNSKDFSDVNERMLVDDEVTKRKRKSVKPAKLNEGELEEDEDVAEDDDEDDDDDEEYNVDDEDDEDYLEENSNRLNQRNGFRNHKPKSNITNSIKKRTATHQRKKRRLSSNSSEQENRRPLRRAAASQKKLTEHTSSSSSNDVTSEDECTLAERRRKKPRVM
uniref:Bromo domain-containing protein n=1 Tax=Lepeophtheirus salmonis TaxID=72036 RepID=A0A0K2UST4_LEPSM